MSDVGARGTGQGAGMRNAVKRTWTGVCRQAGAGHMLWSQGFWARLAHKGKRSVAGGRGVGTRNSPQRH